MNASDSPTLPTSSTRNRWRLARRLLLAAAVLATLVAVFYTVENWRGQRAWENSRRQLEAKGEEFDWNACIPAPVPDNQNFFKAPKMREWFVRDSLQSLLTETPAHPTNAPPPFAPPPLKETNLIVAEVQVVTAGSSPGSGVALQFGDPAAREQAAKLLRQAIGPWAIGPRNNGMVLARSLSEFKPLHLVLLADSVPTPSQLTEFFATNPPASLAPAHSVASYLEVLPAANNAFRVGLKAPVYGAAEYLASTDPLSADFDLVRKALARPYARIDCDYQQPYAIGIPNFVAMRNAAQVLSQRAQCYLLLGQSDAAWHELSLVHDLCRILSPPPSGKPMTLVAAMINVAIGGLYANIVEDGLRLHAWQEPQLLALERQLKDADLLGPVVESFREERAATLRTFETTPRKALVKLFGMTGPTKLVLRCMPRGWFYQNMALGAQLEQTVIASVDLTNRLVRPREVSELVQSLSSESIRHSPYKFLWAFGLPNFAKAVQNMARNQTSLNQAEVACALERYRVANGQYPATLESLSSQLNKKLPHDLINDEPFRYHRTENGGYVLYSVGWNEKDDGGVSGKSITDGDWVWGLH